MFICVIGYEWLVKMVKYLCIYLHVLWLTSKESIPSPESSSSSAGLGACFGVISWYTSLGLRLRSSRSNGSCANRKGDISFITDWNTNRIKLKLSKMRIKLKIDISGVKRCVGMLYLSYFLKLYAREFTCSIALAFDDTGVLVVLYL